MRKGFAGKQIVTVLTNSGSGAGSSTLSLPNTGYANGANLVEILTCADVTVDGNGNVPVPMNGGLPRVLYPKGELSGSGVCGL